MLQAAGVKFEFLPGFVNSPAANRTTTLEKVKEPERHEFLHKFRATPPP